ncbi:AMP-binding protein [Streptomyces sanyensis]|uniref:AMP-binding protein n=1 Tax=Streptomyces sanyensis TaxID=568869 RepID=UPI003D7789EA
MSRSFVEAFARHAADRPDAPALVWEDRPVGYAELYALACRARAQVEAAVPDDGRPVGLRVRKSPETVALVLGCLLAGRSFLLPSHELPDAPFGELGRQAGCSAILSTRPGELVDVVVDPHNGPASPAGHPGGGPGGLPLPRRTAEDAPGFLLTTSGSTGLPKIVPLSYGAVTRFSVWAGETFRVGPGTAVLNYAPLNFDISLLDVWSTLACGGTAVLVDPERATVPRHLREQIVRHRVRVVQGVPLLFRLLLETAAEQGPLEGPEHVVFAGDAMPGRLLDELPRLLPGARWYNNYGCTETNNSFLHEVDRALPVTAPLPIGRPLPGVEWLITGGDGRALHGPGSGELLVSTPFQTAGYANAASGERFGPHPDGVAGRVYYRTGDLATREADGTVRLVGRRDFLVKVRGFQVSTQSVEDVLLEHPEVVEAAVVALPDPVAGHRLHARIRLTGPGAAGVLALRQHCAQRSARAAVPAVIETVREPLPRTSTGKVDRNRIREQLLAAGG